MNQAKAKQAQKTRRIRRVRAKIKGTAERPRLTVKRTLHHLYAQVIDDVAGKTLVAVSDTELKLTGKKPLEVAEAVGKTIAEKAAAKSVKCVVFDRRDRQYHGRVKAVADGARQGGLEF
ncbi:MAG: 50S ribosomal protein L18 [Patescibacteria group bacterium]|nr:50S ribosomal protein L18 [Patescibacteria group bacterium]